MFAGPNGSGKTTIKEGLKKSPQWFGIYINPDEIQKAIIENGVFDLAPFDLTTTTEQIRDFLADHTLLKKHHLNDDLGGLNCDGNIIQFHHLDFNAYHASALSDFLRRLALAQKKSFSFETVMSFPDKVKLLKDARDAGYRNYLYFVATADPQINIQRVANRVKLGGHHVPEDKIRERHARCLALLVEAIPLTSRAFLFDTSEDTDTPWYFAQITEASRIELTGDEIPIWFEPIWKHFQHRQTQ